MKNPRFKFFFALVLSVLFSITGSSQADTAINHSTQDSLQKENDRKKAAFIARSLAKWQPFNENREVHFVNGADVEEVQNSNQNSGNRAAPGNDDECSATAMSVSGCTTGQTTTEATVDFNGGCASTTSLTVWYTFTLTGTNNYIDISFQNETMGAEVELILMSGACGSLSGVDIQCGDPATTTFNFSGLVAGTQYSLQIGNESGQEGTFDVCGAEGEILPGVITGPEQDCDNATNICTSTYTEINSYTGFGSTQELSSTCLLGNETNSVWYVFTVQDISGGDNLEFEIQTTKDYDFALFDITTIGCAGVPSATPVRCNFSGTLGNTGLTNGTATTLPALSEGGGGNSTMADMNDVTVGQTFALIIDNWSGDNNGYTIDFSNSTANLFDNTNPGLSLIDDCSSNTFTITIDENILCSSIGAGEFTLTNTATSTDYSANITGVAGANCGTTTNTLTITHDGTIPTGPYELEIALGNLVDLCGNTVQIGDKLAFNHLGAVGITPSITDICDAGDAVTLTATGGIAGATYAWAPGIAATTVAVTANPVAATIYTLSVTYGGCTKTDTETITLVDNVVTTIDPVDPTICSGTTTLTASTTINGTACVGCTYVWSSTETTAAITKGAGTYTVTATTSGGCAGDNTPSSTISLASAGAGSSCDVIYVSVAGGGNGLTKGAPTDIETALTNAQCTNTTIKCAVGTYTFDKFLDLKSYVTVEGGYNAGFTTKTSNLTSGNATTFVRSATTADGGSGTVFSMFKINAGEDDWRIQNIRIEMPTGHTASSGNGNRAINIGTGCTGYKIVGCYFDAGTGADGTAAGPRNTIMWSSGFESGDSPFTYYLNTGDNCSNATTNVRTGSNAGRSQGTSGGGGSAGAHTGVICTEQISFVGGDDYQVDVYGDITVCNTQYMTIAKASAASYAAINGATGADIIKANASVASTYTLYTGTSTPAGSENYYVGFDLSFGGGGGCKNSALYLDDIVITDVTVAGGTAGGTVYGVYAPDAIDITNGVVDCEATSTAGVSTTEYTVSENGNGTYTSVAVSSYNIVTVDNLVCAATDIDYTRTAGMSTLGDAAPTTHCSTTHTNTTADWIENVTFETINNTTGQDGASSYGDYTAQNTDVTVGSNYTLSVTIHGVGNPGSTGLYVNAFFDWDQNGSYGDAGEEYQLGRVSCSTTIDETGADATTCGSGAGVGLDVISGTIAVPAGATAGLTRFRVMQKYGSYPTECENTTVGEAEDYEVKIYTARTLGSWTALGAGNSLSLPDANVSITNQYSSTGYKTLTTADGSNYEDFINILMAVPSPGTALGAATACPGDVNTYTSSEAGTAGYTYQWALDETGCASCSGTISAASITTSAAVVTLTHTETTAQNVTLTLSITSECCGPLTPITKVVTINPFPNPNPPAVTSATASGCIGGSVGISASSPNTSYSYAWYDAATAGTLLGSNAGYTVDPVISGAANYYLESVSDKGCASSTRAVVTVTGTNTTPVGTGGTFCAQGIYTMNATAMTAGTVFTWYDASSGGSILQTSTSTSYDLSVTCTAACTQSVWLTATETGCTETSPRIQVDAILNAAGATTNWDGGGGDTDWFDNLNWDDCVPSCGQNATIPNGIATYPNIKFAEGIAAVGDGTARSKNLTIAAGASLTFGENKSVLEVCGDWSQNATGVLTMPLGKISFVGTVDQTYTNDNTTAADADFYNVEINNTTGSKTEVTIASGGEDLIINSGGGLSLVAGVLVAPSGRKVLNNNTARGSVSVGTASSWIFGDLDQLVVNGTGNYNFPVGNSTSYQLLYLTDLSNISGGMTNIVGNFTNLTNNTSGLPLAEGAASFTDLLNNGGTAAGTGSTGNMGVWTVTPNSGAADYNLGLIARNYDNQDVEQTVVKRISAGNPWIFDGSTYAGSTISGTTSISAYRTGYTAFSQFAMGKSATVVLSIELSQFSAECVEEGVLINWKTASEKNNAYFIIEKSKDGNLFIEVCKVEGAGNSSESLFYQCTDQSDKNGLYFYRLKQVDFDGKFTYSDLIASNCGHETTGNVGVNIYPNPSNGDLFYIELTDFWDTEVLVVVLDVLGKQYYSKVMIIDNTEYSVTAIDLANRLAAGTYIITGASKNNVFQKKLIVK